MYAVYIKYEKPILMIVDDLIGICNQCVFKIKNNLWYDS